VSGMEVRGHGLGYLAETSTVHHHSFPQSSESPSICEMPLVEPHRLSNRMAGRGRRSQNSFFNDTHQLNVHHKSWKRCVELDCVLKVFDAIQNLSLTINALFRFREDPKSLSCRHRFEEELTLSE
jgi:hypothetical protein